MVTHTLERETTEMERKGWKAIDILGSIILSCVKLEENWTKKQLRNLADYVKQSEIDKDFKKQILEATVDKESISQ